MPGIRLFGTDFHFLCTFSAKKLVVFFHAFSVHIGGVHPHFLKFLDPPLTKFPSILKDVLIVTSSRPEDVTLEELPFLQHPGNPGIDLGFGRIHELSDAQLDDIQEIVCIFNPWSLIV